MNDLQFTALLLDFCQRLVGDGHLEFLEPLEKLLRLHGLPFVLQGVYEMTQNNAQISKALLAITQCLQMPQKALQIAAAEVCVSCILCKCKYLCRWSFVLNAKA